MIDLNCILKLLATFVAFIGICLISGELAYFLSYEYDFNFPLYSLLGALYSIALILAWISIKQCRRYSVLYSKIIFSFIFSIVMVIAGFWITIKH